jgi:peptide/nickel transport system substrate-binding protein
MDHDLDRREFTLGFLSASFAALALSPTSALAAGETHSGAIKDQPWAKWDYKQKPVRGGYFRTAAEQYIGKMNPNRWPVLDWVAMSWFHEKILVNDGSHKPTALWLLDELKWDNPQTVTMKLRPGITFHDGSPLDAKALKYQFDWIRQPDSKTFTVSWLAQLDTVEVVDDLTTRWKFKTDWGSFMGILANAPGYSVSAKALQEDVEKYDSVPQGTGPYMLEEAAPGNFLKLKRNPNWWFAKASGHPDMPYFDGILITVIPDPAVRLANLRAGKIDALTLDKSQVTAAKGDPNLNVYIQPANHLVGFRFNTTKSVFQDIRLRKAVSHAIDRKALIAGTQFGLARIASCIYPGDHWCHNPKLQPVAYDPDLSKKLLAEAGHGGGLKIKGYYSNTSMGQTIAEATKGMLAKVGIDWQVELLAPTAATAKMQGLDYDMGQGGWSFVLEPDAIATGLFHPAGGFNHGASKNDTAIKLIDDGRQATNLEARRDIYWKLEEVLYNNYEQVWLWWEQSATAYRKVVQGWDHENFLKHRESWYFSHPLWFKDGKS